MSWRDIVRTATEAVRTHRLRSALTMLGILIGITAVVLTVGIGEGAKAKVQDQINELGTNILVVSPGSSTSTSGTRGGFGSASTLTLQDASALQSRAVAPDIEAVAPVSTSSVSLVVPVDELDDDADRDHTRVADHPLARRQLRPVHQRGGRGSRELGDRPRPRHRDPAVQWREPDRAVGQLQRREAPGDRDPRRAQLVGRDVEQRPRDRPAQHVLAAARRWRQPELGELDLREGDVVVDAVRRLPGGEHPPAERAQDHDGRQRRLLDRDAAVDPRARRTRSTTR